MTVSGVSFVFTWLMTTAVKIEDSGRFMIFRRRGVPTPFFCQNFCENPLNLKNTPQILALGGAALGAPNVKKRFIKLPNDCEREALIGIKSCGVLSLHVAMETG